MAKHLHFVFVSLFPTQNILWLIITLISSQQHNEPSQNHQDFPSRSPVKQVPPTTRVRFPDNNSKTNHYKTLYCVYARFVDIHQSD